MLATQHACVAHLHDFNIVLLPLLCALHRRRRLRRPFLMGSFPSTFLADRIVTGSFAASRLCSFARKRWQGHVLCIR